MDIFVFALVNTVIKTHLANCQGTSPAIRPDLDGHVPLRHMTKIKYCNSENINCSKANKLSGYI